MTDNQSTIEAVVCANPDCRVTETDRCVEGLEFAACPIYGRAAESAPSAEGAASEIAIPSLTLPGANALTLAQSSKVLRTGAARIISVVGPSDSGKTSLIASLYDLLQDGPVSDIAFAGSSTLHAFEHACHDARAASRRNASHTQRTLLGEVRFFHLDVMGGAVKGRLALLLADRAGEEYRSASDDAAVARTFPEIARADTISMLVDGQRLLDVGARHNLRSDIVMISQALVDAGAARRGQRLALVLTKLDLIRAAPDSARAESDFEALLSEFKTKFGAVFVAVEPFRIAASPKDDTLPRRTGVADLLTFWIGAAAPPETASAPRPVFARAFSRLTPHEAD